MWVWLGVSHWVNQSQLSCLPVKVLVFCDPVLYCASPTVHRISKVISSLWSFAASLGPRTEGAVEGTGTVAVSDIVVTGIDAGAEVPGTAAGPRLLSEIGVVTGEMIHMVAVVIMAVLMAHPGLTPWASIHHPGEAWEGFLPGGHPPSQVWAEALG